MLAGMYGWNLVSGIVPASNVVGIHACGYAHNPQLGRRIQILFANLVCFCVLERGSLASGQLLVQQQLREAFRHGGDYRVVIVIGVSHPAADSCQAAEQHVQNWQRGLLYGGWVLIHVTGMVQQRHVPLIQGSGTPMQYIPECISWRSSILSYILAGCPGIRFQQGVHGSVSGWRMAAQHHKQHCKESSASFFAHHSDKETDSLKYPVECT